MNNTNSQTPITDAAAQLMETVRAMIPGMGAAKPVEEKKSEVVAKQEWEHEGGNLKPAEAKAVKTAKSAKAPKMAKTPKVAKTAKPKKAAAKRRSKPAKAAAKKSSKRTRARR